MHNSHCVSGGGGGGVYVSIKLYTHTGNNKVHAVQHADVITSGIQKLEQYATCLQGTRCLYMPRVPK